MVNMQGGIVTMGGVPHVKLKLHVYGTKENEKRLAPYLTIKRQGLIDANQIRDRISTRRAQCALYRSRW